MAAQPEFRTLEGHKEAVYALAFTPEGSSLITGSFDSTIQVWDVKTGKPLRALRGHTTGITGLALSRDGKRLASAGMGRDNAIRLWDVETGKAQQLRGGHKNSVLALEFSPDGKHLVSTSEENETIVLWDVATGKVSKRWNERKPDKTDSRLSLFYRVKYSPDGKKLYTCGSDRTVTTWDANTAKELSKLTATDFISYPNKNDGKELERQTIASSAKDTLYALALGADGQRIATGGLSGVVRVWSLSSNRPAQTIAGHPGQVVDLCFQASENRLLSCGHRGDVVIWNLQDASAAKRWKLPVFTYCMGLAPAKTLVAVGGADGRVFLLNV